jgi:hypothetical protein
VLILSNIVKKIGQNKTINVEPTIVLATAKITCTTDYHKTQTSCGDISHLFLDIRHCMKVSGKPHAQTILSYRWKPVFHVPGGL